jgi:mannosyltransferase OCH1-like enzyme
MTIPKKIHWCWLSKDPLLPSVKKCLKSWKRVMPDYEIICWDKERFDTDSVQFVKDACAARKWAFAADYIRLYALYTEGGIYLDSDVLVFRRFDRFLNHEAFSGIEFYPTNNLCTKLINDNSGGGY